MKNRMKSEVDWYRVYEDMEKKRELVEEWWKKFGDGSEVEELRKWREVSVWVYKMWMLSEGYDEEV